MPSVTIPLPAAAHEMAQEEIQKKVIHLGRGISNVRFSDGGRLLVFDTPTEFSLDQRERVAVVAHDVQRGLRKLQRKVVFRSQHADRAEFLGSGMSEDVHLSGNGQVMLSGTALRLYRYFDRVLEEMGQFWKARPLLTPTLIPSSVLSRCDYFRSFPQNVTFAAHIIEDAERIGDFRTRHQDRETLDGSALADMETPEACLSPAVCYHVYHLHQNQVLPRGVVAYNVCGKCFRYESSNMRDLRRLWDFTMREIVFLGAEDSVLAERQRGIDRVATFLEQHQLAAEIRTASDPFFIAPDASAKTYFQLSAETKFEVSLLLPNDERLAVGSLNHHTDFFGRAFAVEIEGSGPMHSVCIAFGLERCVCAFLAQHGELPARWPEAVRTAPEFR